MPQIEQLPFIFSSQLFWLLVVFGILYFGIGRGMVPKIRSTVELREQKIAEDLEQAQMARAAAEETEEAYRARMDEVRAEAARTIQEAKQAGARETEDRVRKAAEKISARSEAAEARIREAREAAKAEIESVAIEAAQQMVGKLTGMSVEREGAAAAVKEELHG
ncbi:MAG TPA: ATPase [Sphingomicrobium sp.]|nr:ATPase [Sphingomicrobium sp.]